MRTAARCSALVVFTALGLAACGPDYGSPTTLASVSVAPQQGTVYMIPKPIWDKNDGAAMLNDPEKLGPFRQGVSPVDVKPKTDREYVFVTEHDGKFTTWMSKTVTAKDKNIEIRY